MRSASECAARTRCKVALWGRGAPLRNPEFRERASSVLPAAGLVGLVVSYFFLFYGEFGDEAEVRDSTDELRNYHFPLYEATWAWIRDGQFPT
jgi:hypothetical protein